MKYVSIYIYYLKNLIYSFMFNKINLLYITSQYKILHEKCDWTFIAVKKFIQKFIALNCPACKCPIAKSACV